MWPASHPTDIDALKRKIDELAPRTYTNLAGGLELSVHEAFRSVKRLSLSRETLSRVILLSDGLTNTGLTDHDGVARLAVAARMKGVRVSTIGRDYDEDLMQAIAEAGGGRYHYVESPLQLAGIFEEELKSAFATRARDVHLAFRGSAVVKRAELIGFAVSDGPNVSADWPDFYAGETRTVLLRLKVDARAEGPLDLGRFDMAWRDAESGASGTFDLPIRVAVTSDGAASDRSENRNVAVEAVTRSSRAIRVSLCDNYKVRSPQPDSITAR
jgi:Ca-activated chloride channel family protein